MFESFSLKYIMFCYRSIVFDDVMVTADFDDEEQVENDLFRF